MKGLLLSLVIISSAVCQTSKPVPKPAPVNACQTALKATSQAVDSMAAELATLRAENEKLRADNQMLTAKANEAGKKFTDLRDAAVPVYNYALQLEGAYKQSVTDNAVLSEKFNTLLQQSQNMLQQANARLAKQQRFNNALAMYSAMPKYQPYVLPPPPSFTNSTVNCTSRNMGNTTYTNCQ